MLYDIQKTTIWFAVASIILLVSLVMMVAQDSDREWKKWQNEFVEYQREKAVLELEEAQKAIDSGAVEKLKIELKSAEEDLKTTNKEIQAMTAAIAAIDF
ncbi:MAG: hypothetical protein IIC74_04855, partial [Bacteroidetes bacterium]|nr:hypothetical protein [Bacteroidota bacterium]